MLVCKLPGCPYVRDGRCLEGRGADCPNLIDEAAQTVSEKEIN
jgi:hypothetical protein